MRMKISLAVCTASLFIALPQAARAQNDSDHSGHDNDGKSAAHRQDRPHGFGNVMLSTPTQTAAVAGAMTSVTSQLRSGSFRTSSGAMIPVSAQSNAYGVITSDDAKSPAAIMTIAALSLAGGEAKDMAPDLVKGLQSLRTHPEQLPSVVATYNQFTKVASPLFIQSPPPEFLAIRAALAQLTAAAANAK